MSTLILAALLTTFASEASAGRLDDIRARGELVAAVKTDYPPYGFKDGQGRIVGMEPDMAAELARRLGVSLRLVPVLSLNRAEFLRDGKADLVIATLSITEERRKEIGIIDPPYYAAGAGVLIRRGVRIEETAQLDGRTLCAIEGNIFLADLRAQAPLAAPLLFKDISSAEEALFKSRCEGMYFNDNLLAYKKASEPERFSDYEVQQLIDIDPLPWGIGAPLGEERLALGTFRRRSWSGTAAAFSWTLSANGSARIPGSLRR
ncbi:MAG: transporter substrate-binding domain-containing protein [Rhodomicrobium sp.]